MRIDKKEFNKLKQLDRIEFRQRILNINLFSINFLVLEIITLSFSLLFVILREYFAAIIFVFVGIIFLILVFYSENQTKRLEDEYFKIEVKK